MAAAAQNCTPFYRNKLLSVLRAEEQHAFLDKLIRADLPRRTTIETRKKKTDHVFFLEEGISSLVANNDKLVEVGIVGNEGVTAVSSLFMMPEAAYSSYMQIGGFGYRADSEDLMALMDDAPEVRRLFLAFAHSFLIQTAETAIANARANLEQRLARWILMTHDRMDGNEIPLTHEFLSVMMGARRPGITSAMHELKRKGVIDSARGLIEVVDRAGLLDIAGQYYGKPEADRERQLTDFPSKPLNGDQGSDFSAIQCEP